MKSYLNEHDYRSDLYGQNPIFFCSKTTNSNLRREWSERMKAVVVRRDELVEAEGEQEIRRRAAEQAEKWLVKLRGDLEEKKERKRERGETNEKEE